MINTVKDGVSFANAPGVTFEYSNMGFALLGKIITTVSAMPYQQYITTNILTPLGMVESRWEYNDVQEETLALGYRWEDETWKPEPLLHDGSYGAMGGLICSLEDFSKYVALHLSAWPPRDGDDNGPVQRSSIREMHQPWRFGGMYADAKTRSGANCPVVTGYGYGLGWRKDCNGLVRVSHSGGLPGFGSDWRIYPEYGIGVVSFSNRTYGAPGLPNAISLDTLIQLAGLKPRVLLPSQILSQRKQEIATIIQSWNDEKALAVFAENFFMDQSLDRWKQATEKLLAESGKIKHISDVTPENQLRGTFIVEGEKKNIEVFFTLTPEKQALIQQLDLRIQEPANK